MASNIHINLIDYFFQENVSSFMILSYLFLVHVHCLDKTGLCIVIKFIIQFKLVNKQLFALHRFDIEFIGMEMEPKSPDDEGLKDLIDDLASNVAKWGIKFEEIVKTMQDLNDKYDLSFIEEGKPFNDYYRHKVCFMCFCVFKNK